MFRTASRQPPEDVRGVEYEEELEDSESETTLIPQRRVDESKNWH